MICDEYDCKAPANNNNVRYWGEKYGNSYYCNECYVKIVDRFTCHVGGLKCGWPISAQIFGPGAGLFWDHFGCNGKCDYCTKMFKKYWIDMIALCKDHEHLLPEIEKDITMSKMHERD